jgi:hypothetical protein
VYRRASAEAKCKRLCKGKNKVYGKLYAERAQGSCVLGDIPELVKYTEALTPVQKAKGVGVAQRWLRSSKNARYVPERLKLALAVQAGLYASDAPVEGSTGIYVGCILYPSEGGLLHPLNYYLPPLALWSDFSEDEYLKLAWVGRTATESAIKAAEAAAHVCGLRRSTRATETTPKVPRGVAHMESDVVPAHAAAAPNEARGRDL